MFGEQTLQTVPPRHLDSDASHHRTLETTENLTANRVLNFNPGNADVTWAFKNVAALSPSDTHFLKYVSGSTEWQNFDLFGTASTWTKRNIHSAGLHLPGSNNITFGLLGGAEEFQLGRSVTNDAIFGLSSSHAGATETQFRINVDTLFFGSGSDPVSMKFDAATANVGLFEYNGTDDAFYFLTDIIIRAAKITFQDNQPLVFGSGVDGRLRWETAGTNDFLVMGLKVGAAATSGYFVIMEDGDIGNSNRQPSGTTADPTLRIYSSDATQANDYLELYHNQIDAVLDWGNGNLSIKGGDVMISDANGFVVGHSSKIDFGATPEFQVLGTATPDSSMGFARFENNGSGPDVRFLKSRGATIGANIIVNDGDTLGRFRFQGADGGDFNTTAAEILCKVDGAPSLNDIPGKIVFRTRLAGGALADKMTIDNAGNFDFNSGTLANLGTITADWDVGSFEVRAQTFESDVATGTIPLVIASTTKCTNLNADLVDGKHVGTSGNVVPLLDAVNTWSNDQIFGDNDTFVWGGGTDSGIAWVTLGARDFMALVTAVGSDDQSGYISIMELADIANSNRVPAASTANPTLRIYSADATQISDYLEFYHNQTDARFDWANGNLGLGNSTLSVVQPDTTEKIDLGSSTKAFHDAHIYGDLVLGVAEELTILSGVVTVTKSYQLIDTESDASTDDLVTINGGQPGMFLIIRPASNSRTIVAKDGSGNLLLAGDFSMDNSQDMLVLLFDVAGFWIELTRSNNA